MTSTNPPQGDRAGKDYSQGTNPNPGGDIDTGDSAVPPYDDKSTSDDEFSQGTRRAMGSEPPLREPNEPAAEAPDDLSDAQAPDDVGVSMTRRGEDIAQDDGKEAGRVDTGTHEAPSNRPTGESTDRDRSGVDPG